MRKPKTRRARRRPASRGHTDRIRYNKRETSNSNIYYKIRNLLVFLERDPFVRLALAGVFLITLFQISEDLRDRKEERQFRAEERSARQEERIARAWSILTTPAAGNSGKTAALETLFRAGVSLRGIDLSCESMGGGWNEKELECDRPVDLTGLNLKSPASHDWTIKPVDDHEKAAEKPEVFWRKGCLAKDLPLKDGAYVLSGGISSFESHVRYDTHPHSEERNKIRKGGVDFRDAKLSGVDFTNAKLSGVNFSGADLRGVVFSETIAEGGLFENTQIQGMKINSSYLNGAQFGGTRISCWDAKSKTYQENINCKFSNYAPKIRIRNSWMDGVEIIHPAAFQFQIHGSTLINARIELGQYPGFKEPNFILSPDIGDDDISVSKNWQNVIFHRNNFTCSQFINDKQLSLGRSNISGTSFPPRYVSRDIYESSDTASLTLEKWHNDHFGTVPWAWSNNPPQGNLAGEVVAACNYEHEEPASKLNAVDIYPPKSCETSPDMTPELAQSVEKEYIEPRVFNFPPPELEPEGHLDFDFWEQMTKSAERDKEK